MADQTRQLLERGAGDPPPAPEFDGLWQRGRRQRRAIRIATGGAATVAVAAAAFVVTSLPAEPPPGMQVADQPSSPTADATTLDDSQRAEQQDAQLAEQPPTSHSPQPPPGPMNVDPEEASPGDTIALTFPEESPRGVNFVLQTPTNDDDWRDIAYLFTDGNDGQPLTLRVEEAPDDLGFTSVRVAGPGPDHVVLPTGLTVGEYRICEAHTLDEPMCARITVR